ncbi:MAG: hypothetical protein P1V81_06785 [Planctomycetota bacterium]|nr:hypothetical protein [Planctomycetota bacterium]
MARFSGDTHVDQRELDNGFRKLPPEVRDEVRAGWRADDQSEQRFLERGARLRYRPILEGAGLFLAANAVALPWSLPFLLGSAMAGAFAGALWKLIRDQENLAGPAALVAWVLGIWLAPPPQLGVNAFFAATLVVALSPLLARERACRGTGLV